MEISSTVTCFVSRDIKFKQNLNVNIPDKAYVIPFKPQITFVWRVVLNFPILKFIISGIIIITIKTVVLF